jgi:glycerophosphoryl diester phosphodiesterase
MIDKPLAPPVPDELEVFPFTVNNPNRVAELAGFGVSGIITDDPGLIRQTLEGNP